MAEEQHALAPDEAIYLLECVASGESEGRPYDVGPRRANLTDAQVDALIERLARLAGLELDVVRREVWWWGGR